MYNKYFVLKNTLQSFALYKSGNCNLSTSILSTGNNQQVLCCVNCQEQMSNFMVVRRFFAYHRRFSANCPANFAILSSSRNKLVTNFSKTIFVSPTNKLVSFFNLKIVYKHCKDVLW